MSAGNSSIWGVHIDALQQRFPGRVQMLQVTANMNQGGDGSEGSKIVQCLRVIDRSGWDVIVKLPHGFPDAAPQITFAEYRIPFRWSVDMLLPEAVDQAVNSLGKLAGGVGVISLNDLAQTVTTSSACAAAHGAGALKALVDSAPLVQRCQAELELLWGEIERTARGNLAMQPQIAQQQTDVAALQHQVRAGLAALGGRRRDVLEALPLGSADGLLRSAKEELRELEEAAAAACKLLGAPPGAVLPQLARGGRAASIAAAPAPAPASAHFSITTPYGANNSLPSADEQQQQQQQQHQQADTDAMNGVGTGASTANPDNIFFVPTGPAERNSPGPFAGGGGGAGTAPSSVFTAPFSLDSGSSRAGGDNNTNLSSRRVAADIDDDEDDDHTDEMERRVEYAVKMCTEARRAALLIRRFGGMLASTASAPSAPTTNSAVAMA